MPEFTQIAVTVVSGRWRVQFDVGPAATNPIVRETGKIGLAGKRENKTTVQHVIPKIQFDKGPGIATGHKSRSCPGWVTSHNALVGSVKVEGRHQVVGQLPLLSTTRPIAGVGHSPRLLPALWTT